MVASENRIGVLEAKVDRLEDRVDGLYGLYDRMGRVEGVQQEMSKRLDDVHKRMNDVYKLLITLIAIGGGGLITAVVSLVLQLVRQ